jgi:hypothetical protein
MTKGNEMAIEVLSGADRRIEDVNDANAELKAYGTRGPQAEVRWTVDLTAS